MTMIPIASSSNLSAYTYDPETKRMTVQFKNGGSYHYHDVPQQKADGFSAAQSKGQYLHQNIKGVHRHEKVK